MIKNLRIREFISPAEIKESVCGPLIDSVIKNSLILKFLIIKS